MAAGGCKEEDRVGVGDADASQLPTMMTRDVVTLVSDSGVTKFRIETPVWYVYDNADTPVWRFPEGVWLETYDPEMNVQSTVTADSAVYFKHSQLWRLDGHVDIAGVAAQRFLTPQLFWDQRQHKLYSDSFIHIERPDQVLEGYGFDSNEQLTRYNVRSVSGIFPTSAFQPSDGDDEPPAQPPVTSQSDEAAPAADEPARIVDDAPPAQPDNSNAPKRLKRVG